MWYFGSVACCRINIIGCCQNFNFGSSSLPSSFHRSDVDGHLRIVKSLVHSTTKIPPPLPLPSPIVSLRLGNWVKIICGASFEDTVDVRNLSLVYTLAGVDCIDCAASAPVVNAVNEGINAAMSIAMVKRPWVMVSVNDDKGDLHFRKAEFDPEDCPSDCPRPCEKICPATAISLQWVLQDDKSAQNHRLGKLQGGVITERCYGCGRCFSICPYDRIRSTSYVRDPTSTSKLLQRNDVDAIEIHTNGRHTDLFNELWDSLGDSVENVKLVAVNKERKLKLNRILESNTSTKKIYVIVSLPYVCESTLPVMDMIYAKMQQRLKCYNLWQLDGRSMSGDIGRGATREAINFAVHVATASNKPHGFYQLAGGTNAYTVERLKKEGLFQTSTTSESPPDISEEEKQAGTGQACIGGIAYGSYARKIVGKVLRKLPNEDGHGPACIEDHPKYLLEALKGALALVGPIKGYGELVEY